MLEYIHVFCVVTLLFTVPTTEGTNECVTVSGQIVCNKDPQKAADVFVTVWDRDGRSIFAIFDPDDPMGNATSDHNGRFETHGCASDHDWTDLYLNKPEPYLKIEHYCNDPSGETLIFDKNLTFDPLPNKLGAIVLDSQ